MADAIVLEGVGKRYRLTNDSGLLIKRLLNLGRGRYSDLWALHDISFRCEAGETVGVIGRNGSGKTTMLRLLAGVSAPTVGRLRVVGSISPLIGVGVGFNQELTGRENVFTNGQILGMSKARIKREFDEIVAFAELEDFLDVPVKFYSTGMFLRLAFAVAVQVQPEVILVDEILAVGDVAFQAKCVDRMTELKESGATIVVVTHNMHTLHRMCARTIVLSRGRVAFDGATDDAVSVYHEVMHEEGAKHNDAGIAVADRGGHLPFVGGARVTCEILGSDDRPTRSVRAGQELRVRVHAEFERSVSNPVVGLAVHLHPDTLTYLTALQPGDYHGEHGPGAPMEVTVTMNTPLLAGTFNLVAAVLDGDGKTELGRSSRELFAVTSTVGAQGIVDLSARFTIGGAEHLPRQLRLVR